MKLLSGLVACLVTVSTSPGVARTPDNGKTWIVERGTYQCSLTKTKGPKFAVELNDSISGPTVLAMRFSSSEFIKRPGEIVLLPSGVRFVRDSSMWIPGGYIVAGLPNDFLAQFAQSSGLIINVDGKKKFEFSFESPSEGVKTLESCHDMLLSSWGIDQARNRDLKRQPTPLDDGQPVIRQEELREITTEAMTRYGGGTTVITYTVLPDGRVSNDCRAIVSSGLPTLDAFACSSVTKRARFEPGLDATGGAVAVRIADMYRWAFSRP